MTDIDKRLEETLEEIRKGWQSGFCSKEKEADAHLWMTISVLLDVIERLRAEAKAARQGLPPDCDLLRDIAKEERRKALEEAAEYLASYLIFYDKTKGTDVCEEVQSEIRALMAEGK